MNAQENGSIVGKIIDKEANDEPLAFANVLIKGTTKGTTTDFDGLYEIANIAPGVYTLSFSYLGYESVEIPNIKVETGKVTTINIPMSASEGVSLQEVVVTTTARKDSETALLLDQKKAVEMKQSIGAQELSRKGVSDAAGAISKISGISKQEGSSNVYVRGLGDRYLNTTLNGLSLPSNDVNKKNIDLTLFSTDVIENISVSKAYSSKFYGDFSAGNVDITSKNYTGNGFIDISAGSSFNTNSVGKDFVRSEGTGFFGYYGRYSHNPFAIILSHGIDPVDAGIPININYGGSAGKSFDFKNGARLSLFLTGSFENSYESPVYIKQFSDTKVTFSLLHSNSAVVEPSNIVSSGINHVFSIGGGETLVNIDWDITLGSSQCIIARQPIATDFEFTTTEVTKTSKTADLSQLELKDVSKLKLNMGVSGAGINACIIKGINKGYYDANNSTVNNPVYKSPVVLETNYEGKVVMVEDKGGTITLSVAADAHVADRVITFTGKGPSDSKQFNNTDFSISNFKLTIDPVVTTTDAVVANSTTIPITSTNGIKAADTILMSGIGVTTTAPHVDTVNSGVSVVVSTAQTIENGQTVTFTGSSRVAKITADVIIKDHGDSDITLKLNLDNILTVG